MTPEPSPRSVARIIEQPGDGSIEVLIRSKDTQTVLTKLEQSEFVYEFEQRPFDIVQLIIPQTHLETVNSWGAIESIQVNHEYTL